MKDEKKTKKQLMDELRDLRRQMPGLRRTEEEYERADDIPEGKEEYYRLATEHANDGIVIVRGDRNLFFNRKCLELAGYQRPEDIQDETLISTIHPEDREMVRDYARRRQEGESVPSRYECRIVRTDGSILWVEISSSAIIYKGKPASFSFIRDITERKQAEKTLQESEERYRTILDNIEDGYHEVDLAGRYMFFNESFQRIVGYSHEEMMGMSYKRNVSDEENAGIIFQAYNSVYRTGIPIQRVECDITRKDGSRRTVEISVSLIKDHEGRPAGFRGIVRDITERKRFEKALLESEEKYRNLVERAHDGIAIVQDGIVKYANPRLVEMWGGPAGEVFGSPFMNFIDPKELPRVVEYYRRRMGGGDSPSVYETKLRRRDGGTVYAELSAGIIHYEEKPADLAVVRDITERRRAEEALKKSEQQLALAIEGSGVGLWDLQVQTGETDFNERWAQIIGYTLQELAPISIKTWACLTHPDDLAKSRFFLQKHFDSELPVYECELRMRHKGGHWVWVLDRGKVVEWDENGKPVRMTGTHLDITERKQAEEALREKEEWYRAFFNTSRDCIFITSVDGCWIDLNDAAVQLFGYDSREELMDVRIADLYVNPDDRTQHLRTIEGKGYLQEYPVALRKKDGTVIDTLITSVARKDSTGKVFGFQGTIRDITERKQAEEARRRAEEEKRRLEERLHRSEKMEALGTMAGGVAHDLNNVLGIVVGYAEMLLMDEEKSRPIRPHLVNIMNGGQRAAAIVDDLLTLARRGVSGRQVLNLNKIITDGQQLPEFERLCAYHPSVTIKTDLEPDLLNISGSSVHLSKTLFNLISNASEAMPGGGIVTIRTANQYLDKPIQGYDEVREGDYVVLSVSDTGEGIPAGDLKRIFEPFYTRKVMGRSGTGLGLAVVWGTVKDHHGYINIQSEEGRGTTFTLYFPVTREDLSAEAAAVAISEYRGGGEAILVVDDVKEQRDLAAGMLRKLNYSVSSVSSGEEAVAYLKTHRVDLMVLDMIMDPGMDGLDTYRKVLDVRPKQKAIIVSGFSESDRVRDAQALGAGAYVKKPYVIESLGMAVKAELDRK